MWIVQRLLCALLLHAAFCQATLWTVTSGEDIIVVYNGTELVRYSPSFPAVILGKGEASFTESQGNFEVNDTIYEERPLSSYDVWEETATRVQVNLWDPLDEGIRVGAVFDEVADGDGSSVTLNIIPLLNNTSVFNRLWVQVYAEEDERVYGAGEQYTYFNLRGHEFPIWTREQGVGRDGGIIANLTDIGADAGGAYHTTYWPQASHFSSRNLSMMAHNYDYMVLDYTSATYHSLYSHGSRLDLEWLFGSSPMDVVEKVATRLGTQPPLPDWIITGAILGLEEGTNEVTRYYNMAREAGVNVSALWLQDWSGTTETIFGHRVYWNWAWNETYYPDLDILTQQLAEEGVQVTVYCNPHLIEGSSLYQEALEQDHLMLGEDGQEYLMDFGGFLAGTVDLLDAASSEWYSDVLRRNILDLGMKGWMADFGEYTGLDMVSRNTFLTREEVHNLLPRAWAEANRVAVEGAGALEDAVYWMRSGALGSSGYQTLAWAGDQNVDFSEADGVASTIVAALSLAVSGMGLSHFDIGGYTTQAPVLVRTQELFLRSAEYAVFTPVMRTHLGNKPESNHQFYSSNDTLTQFARLTQLHARLAPYTRAQVYDNSNNGTPVQRPLFLHFPQEEEAWDTQHQYLYGPDLLVAPVTEKRQAAVNTYFPSAQWHHLLGVTPSVLGPALLEVDAPMGYPVVYYREGSQWEQLFQDITAEFGLE